MIWGRRGRREGGRAKKVGQSKTAGEQLPFAQYDSKPLQSLTRRVLTAKLPSPRPSLAAPRLQYNARAVGGVQKSLQRDVPPPFFKHEAPVEGGTGRDARGKKPRRTTTSAVSCYRLSAVGSRKCVRGGRTARIATRERETDR